MEKEIIKVTLFRNSKSSFLPILDEKGIKTTPVPIHTGVAMAAGETIEILKVLEGASPFAVLAWVCGRMD
jgi:hypothetical protein